MPTRDAQRYKGRGEYQEPESERDRVGEDEEGALGEGSEEGTWLRREVERVGERGRARERGIQLEGGKRTNTERDRWTG